MTAPGRCRGPGSGVSPTAQRPEGPARSRRLLGDDHPDTLRAQGNLAETLRSLGELDPARQLLEDVLAGYRRVLGDDHPDTLQAQGNLANTLKALRELDQAGSPDPSEAGP